MNAPEPPLTRSASVLDRPYPAWVLLALVTFLAAGLRLAGIDESLWLDELHTAWTVSGSWLEIPQRAAIGNYSPLYFFFCRAVVGVVGMSEVALRLPSLAAGILLVPLAFFAVLRWTESRAAALLTAWLIATDGLFVLFAQEARPYALIQCLGLVHVLVFWRVLQTPTWRMRTALVGLGICLFYLHYTAILLLVAEMVAYVVLCLRRSARPTYGPGQVCLDLGLILIACLPAAGHLWEIAARRANWRAFVQPRSLMDITSAYPYPLMVYVYLPAALAAVIALSRELAGFRPALTRLDGRLVVVLLCWYAVPVGIAWVATNTDVARLLFPRYVMVASLVPVVAAGMLCGTGANRWIRLGVATLVVAAVLAADGMGYHDGPLRPFLLCERYTTRGAEDWQDAVQDMNAQPVAAQQPVFVQAGLIEAEGLGVDDNPLLVDYCLLPVTSAIYPLDLRQRSVWPVRNRRPLISDPAALADAVDRRGAWLIIRGSREQANRTLAGFIQAFRDRQVTIEAERRQSYPGLELIHVEISE